MTLTTALSLVVGGARRAATESIVALCKPSVRNCEKRQSKKTQKTQRGKICNVDGLREFNADHFRLAKS
jgi:hypothetical protein